MAQLVKRAVKGSWVSADAKGDGNTVIGQITSWDKDTIFFEDATSGEVFGIKRGEVFKATKEQRAEGEKALENRSEEGNTVSRSIVPKWYRETYVETRNKAGRKSLDNGDSVALLLRGKSLEEVYAIAARELDESKQSLVSRYNHLNKGHQRMCLGNRMRSALKK